VIVALLAANLSEIAVLELATAVKAFSNAVQAVVIAIVQDVIAAVVIAKAIQPVFNCNCFH